MINIATLSVDGSVKGEDGYATMLAKFLNEGWKIIHVNSYNVAVGNSIDGYMSTTVFTAILQKEEYL